MLLPIAPLWALHFRLEDPGRSTSCKVSGSAAGPQAPTGAGARLGSTRRGVGRAWVLAPPWRGPGPPPRAPLGRPPRALPRYFPSPRDPDGNHGYKALPAGRLFPRWGGSGEPTVNWWANEKTPGGGRCHEDEEGPARRVQPRRGLRNRVVGEEQQVRRTRACCV